MKSFLSTLLLSLRLAIKAPTNTLLCLFVLASGIAIVASMFRVSQVVVFPHVPYEDADRMSLVCRTGEGNSYDVAWSVESYRLFAEKQVVFEDTLPIFSRPMALLSEGKGQRVRCALVGTNFSKFTGVMPILGRALEDADAVPNAEKVAVIGERLWASHFHSDRYIVGKTMILNGAVRTIVGVMPESFDGPTPLSGIQLWVPLNLDTIHGETGWNNYISFLAKTRKEIPPSVAAERANALAAEIYKALPDENRTMRGARLRKVNGELFDDNTVNTFIALFVCSILILFMACGIASGLMTARYSSRTQEFAIRTALGASRARLVFQMVAEFALVSISATILGLLLYYWIATSYLTTCFERFGLPSYMMRQSDWPLYLFVLGVLFVITAASTILPAMRASRTDIASILRESTRTGSSLRVTRLSNILIVWQVASAGSILCGGALMGSMIREFAEMNDYCDAENYICATVSFNPNDHGASGAKLDRVNRIMDEFANYPELEKYGMSNEFFGYGETCSILVEGTSWPDPERAPKGAMRVVSPGYFAATNVQVLRGREFEKADNVNDKRPTVVTDFFAKKIFGTTDVIGKRFKYKPEDAWLTVVGVVPDLFVSDGSPERPAGFYVPYSVAQWQDIVIFAKPHRGVDAGSIMTKMVSDIDDRISLSDIMPVTDYRRLYGGGLYMRFLFSLFLTFAAGALLMSAAGLYGIISFSVNSRRKDMGIRLALGATPGSVILLTAKSGIIHTIIGMIFAVFGTIIIRRLIVTEFTRILHPSGMIGAYLTAAGILLLVTGLAILIPAIRGASVEPSNALRDE